MAKDLSLTNITDSGLSGIGRIPFGVHFCHFYRQRQELVDSLIPYFQAGLHNKERCVWMAADPFPADEAEAEIAKVIPSFGSMIKEGHIRIFDAEELCTRTEGKDMLGLWRKEEQRALAEGYQGLRIASNTSFLARRDWDTFMAYENSANKTFESLRIVALCSYRLILCPATEVFEVIRNHNYTLRRREDSWRVLEKDTRSENIVDRHSPRRAPVPGESPACTSPIPDSRV